MKANYSYFITLLLTLLMMACSYTGEYREVQINDLYAMSFPDFMMEEKDKKLSQTALLQYCNYFRNIYTIVNHYPKTAMNDSVSMATLGHEKYKATVQLLERPQFIDSTQLTISGLPARQYQFTGTVGIETVSERIFYNLVLVESPTHYYEIVFWTWDSWREKYKEDLPKIINSFHEL